MQAGYGRLIPVKDGANVKLIGYSPSAPGTYSIFDPEKLTYSGEGGAGDKKLADGKVEPIPNENHMANWIDCMRSRKRPNADIEFGHQHAAATIMAANALETGQRMRYDREQRKIYPG